MPKENAYRLYVPVASLVVDTATHCINGLVLTNWLRNQRFAILSYCTMGSPLLLVWHVPPKPAQIALPNVGPATSAPVFLLKTANSRFTHCTYWVAPTTPLVSGGAACNTNPYCPRPRPSKFSPKVAETGGRTCSCKAASGTALNCAGCSCPVERMSSVRGENGFGCAGVIRIMSVSGGET